MLNKKYCVVGIGYVGLPCAIILANTGCSAGKPIPEVTIF